MIIYIMRHGQTVWNAKDITQGRSQNRLSKLGKAQVEEVAKKFKQGDVDIIITSPLMRTMQTTNIVNKVLKTKILRDERIIEIDKGALSGRAKETFTEEEKRLKKENPHLLKMESLQDVAVRVKEFSKYLKENYKNKKVLVITHNVVATILEKILLNKEAEIFEYYNVDKGKKGKYKNAELRKFTLD